jgi:type VI protein secretion system component Hcp
MAAAAAFVAGPAQAASEYFIRVDGIAGTSLFKGLEDYIQIQSWSLGFDSGACQGLQFVKQMDASSADFTVAALSGTVYPRIILIARKPGAVPFLYMRLTLTSNVFTTFKTGSNTSDDSLLPIEQISARPSRVKTELFGQDDRGQRIPLATSEVNCP